MEKTVVGLFEKVKGHVYRYGLRIFALILLIESIWAASVLAPVLFVIAGLFHFTNAWMAVLPGFLGALTFLIALTIGGLAAAMPSTYVGRWRDRLLDNIARRYPEPQQPSMTVTPAFTGNFEMQDAD